MDTLDGRCETLPVAAPPWTNSAPRRLFEGGSVSRPHSNVCSFAGGGVHSMDTLDGRCETLPIAVLAVDELRPAPAV